jgi:hypothetical protein
MTRVVVHIGQITLRGVRVEDRGAFAKGLAGALEGDLSRACGWEKLASSASVKNESGVRVAPRLPSDRLGERIGRNIAKGLLR